MELLVVILVAALGAVAMGLLTRRRKPDGCGGCTLDCESSESCDVRS